MTARKPSSAALLENAMLERAFYLSGKPADIALAINRMRPRKARLSANGVRRAWARLRRDGVLPPIARPANGNLTRDWLTAALRAQLAAKLARKTAGGA